MQISSSKESPKIVDLTNEDEDKERPLNTPNIAAKMPLTRYPYFMFPPSALVASQNKNVPNNLMDRDKGLSFIPGPPKLHKTPVFGSIPKAALTPANSKAFTVFPGIDVESEPKKKADLSPKTLTPSQTLSEKNFFPLTRTGVTEKQKKLPKLAVTEKIHIPTVVSLLSEKAPEKKQIAGSSAFAMSQNFVMSRSSGKKPEPLIGGAFKRPKERVGATTKTYEKKVGNFALNHTIDVNWSEHFQSPEKTGKKPPVPAESGGNPLLIADSGHSSDASEDDEEVQASVADDYYDPKDPFIDDSGVRVADPHLAPKIEGFYTFAGTEIPVAKKKNAKFAKLAKNSKNSENSENSENSKLPKIFDFPLFALSREKNDVPFCENMLRIVKGLLSKAKWQKCSETVINRVQKIDPALSEIFKQLKTGDRAVNNLALFAKTHKKWKMEKFAEQRNRYFALVEKRKTDSPFNRSKVAAAILWDIELKKTAGDVDFFGESDYFKMENNDFLEKIGRIKPFEKFSREDFGKLFGDVKPKKVPNFDGFEKMFLRPKPPVRVENAKEARADKDRREELRNELKRIFLKKIANF